MEHSVDLTAIQKAVDNLREKYPHLSFGSDFEPTVNGFRGIFDLQVTEEKSDHDARHTISIIVSNPTAYPNIQTEDYFLQRIEEHLRYFGII